MLSARGPIAMFVTGLLITMGFSGLLAPTVSAASEGNTSADAEYHVRPVPNSIGGGFEPHLLVGKGVDGDECVYIDSPTGLGSRTSGNLWISKDHGDTWEVKTKGNFGGSVLGSGDSYTAVTNDGTIYFTDLWLFTVTVDTSNDGGNSWVRNPQGSVTPIDDRQWFMLGPSKGNFPFTQPQSLYLQYNQIPGGLFLMKSQITKWGLGWRPCNAYRPISTTTGSRDNFAVDQRDGTIYMPNTEDTTLEMYTSTDGCASWSKSTVMTMNYSRRDQNIFVVADVDKAGNVYLTWATQDTVEFARSTDKGKTWQTFNVTTTNGTRVLPWITAGDEGRIAIVYYETNATGISDASIRASENFNEEVSWGVVSAISIDALSAQPNFTFQTVLNYTHTGAIRVSGTGGNSDRDLGDFMSNDMDKYGRNLVTFGYDGNDGANKYDSLTMFARQRDGPFLTNGTGPVANFTYDVDGMDVKVDGTRSYDMNGRGLSIFEWLWGDGTNESGQIPITYHTFKKTGNYHVALRVTNMLDMRNTTYNWVIIKVSGGLVVSPGLAIAAVIIIVALIMTFLFRKKIKGLFGKKDFLKKTPATQAP